MQIRLQQVNEESKQTNYKRGDLSVQSEKAFNFISVRINTKESYSKLSLNSTDYNRQYLVMTLVE